MTSYISDLLIKFYALKFIVGRTIHKKMFLTLKKQVCGGVSVSINKLVRQDKNSKIKM